MDALNLLAKAPSKKVVNDLFVLCFKNRHKPITEREKTGTAELLKINEDQSESLLKAIREVVTESLYYTMGTEEISNYMSSAINPKVKDLVAKIVVEYLPQWREAAIKNQVSLPLLQNIDWRIDIKSASDHLSRMSIPTVLVQLQVADSPTSVEQAAGTRNINFELTKEALEIMLDGLGQIKKQLDSI